MPSLVHSRSDARSATKRACMVSKKFWNLRDLQESEHQKEHPVLPLVGLISNQFDTDFVITVHNFHRHSKENRNETGRSNGKAFFGTVTTTPKPSVLPTEILTNRATKRDRSRPVSGQVHTGSN
jgi:hypothetical protein